MSAVTSLLRLTRPARIPRGAPRAALPTLEPVVPETAAGAADQRVEGVFAELIRGLDGAFVPLGGAVGVGRPDEEDHAALELMGTGLSTRGALAWTRSGRTRLTFLNPVYSMATQTMRARIDGGLASVTVFRLDTGATRLDLVDTSSPLAPWAPRLRGTVAVLAPAGADAFNAAFDTTAFSPGLPVGEVSFRL